MVDWTGGVDRAVVRSGPPLRIPDGASDLLVAGTSYGVVLAGGESERGDKDRELLFARLLTPPGLEVVNLPRLLGPHDDGVAVVVDDQPILIGGQIGREVLGNTVPVTVRTVQRLVWVRPNSTRDTVPQRGPPASGEGR